jgi:hypothetical protein
MSHRRIWVSISIDGIHAYQVHALNVSDIHVNTCTEALDCRVVAEYVEDDVIRLTKTGATALLDLHYLTHKLGRLRKDLNMSSIEDIYTYHAEHRKEFYATVPIVFLCLASALATPSISFRSALFLASISSHKCA